MTVFKRSNNTINANPNYNQYYSLQQHDEVILKGRLTRELVTSLRNPVSDLKSCRRVCGLGSSERLSSGKRSARRLGRHLAKEPARSI